MASAGARVEDFLRESRETQRLVLVRLVSAAFAVISGFSVLFNALANATGAGDDEESVEHPSILLTLPGFGICLSLWLAVRRTPPLINATLGAHFLLASVTFYVIMYIAVSGFKFVEFVPPGAILVMALGMGGVELARPYLFITSVALVFFAWVDRADGPLGVTLHRVFVHLALLLMSLVAVSGVIDQHEKQVAYLRAALAAEARFISVCSHELRTPLNALLSYAQFLGDADEGNGRTRSEDVRGVQSAAAVLQSVVDNVLAYSGEVPPVEMLPLSTVSTTIEALQHVLASALASNKATLVTERSGEELLKRPDLFVDSQVLQQVLLNVLGNAIKFSPPGTSILFRVEVSETRVRAIVQDSGPGIAAADAGSIFVPFRRLNNAVGKPGLGLGLAISTAAVARVNGSLRLRAPLPGHGKGACFQVDVPVERRGDVGVGRGRGRGRSASRRSSSGASSSRRSAASAPGARTAGVRSSLARFSSSPSPPSTSPRAPLPPPPHHVHLTRSSESSSFSSDRSLGDSSSSATGLHVLIVDDIEFNRSILERQLRRLGNVLAIDGLRITCAPDGVTALALAAKDPPHLLLVDMYMGDGLSGAEVSLLLRRRLAATTDAVVPRILAVSATSFTPEFLADHGIDGALLKPIKRPRLQAELDSVWLGLRG